MVLTRSHGKHGKSDASTSTAAVSSGLAPPQPTSDLPGEYVLSAASVSGAASSSGKSSASSRTVRRLALQAEHARRIVDLEKNAMDLELQAKLAELEEEGGRNASVKSWLESNKTEHSYNECDSQMPLFTAMVAEPSGASAAPVTTAEAVAEAPTRTLRPEGYSSPTVVKMPARPSGTSRAGRHCQEGYTAANDARQEGLIELAQAIESMASKPRVSQPQLPLFDGRAADWLIFNRIYEATKNSFTPAENLARLSTSLRGVARETVSILLVAAHDPDQVVTALSKRFGNSDHILLHEINTIKALPRLHNSESPSELLEFSCKIRNCVETIKLLNHNEYLASPELANAIIGKLTPALRAQWAHFAFDRAHLAYKLELLSQFLDHEAEVRNRFGFMTDNDIQKIHVTDSYVKSKNPVLNKKIKKLPNNDNSIKCKYCQATNHEVDCCPKFLLLSIDDKWRWVKEHKVCHRCLRRGSHQYRFCRHKDACAAEGCARKHHKILHFVAPQVNDNDPPATEPPSTPPSSGGDASNDREVVAHASSASNQSKSLATLLKIIPVTVSGPRGSVNTYALLDDGSTGTFIDSKVSKSIGAHGPKTSMRMDCINGLSKEAEIEFVDINIKGQHCDESFRIKNARSIQDLNLSPSHSISAEQIKSYPHLTDLCDIVCHKNVVPMLLIGMDNWHLIISKETRRGSRSQPVACRTSLGWVLFGLASSRTNAVSFINHCATSSKPDDVDILINNYYKLDSIGITKATPRSELDKRALEIIENTSTHLPSGHFEVGLLWRSDNMQVPKGSYNLALNRFKSLERKFNKNPEYAESYRRNINDVIDKGYAELCPSSSNSSTITWYLPHFGVINPNKPGKLRVVHDAAALCDGMSLNSMLLSGPDLLQPILDILVRFREGRNAIAADIREMFPQVKIRAEDRDAQRFLWRESPDIPIKSYRMSSMIFGAASSPFTALYVKNKNALEFKDKYPEAVDAIIKNHYMDDYLGSHDSIEEAANMARDIVYIHKQARFEMRGWVSNEPKTLDLIPSNLCHQQNLEINLGSFPDSVRTLGLIWHPENDTIGFNISSSHVFPDKITKRTVLSQLMRVFDPLGLLSPLIISGRILFQNAWRKGLEWDQEFSHEESIKWRRWFANVSAVKNLKIPRCYSKIFPITRELHIFCDASEDAYAAVVYWRFIYSDGSVQLSLIGSKARVTPLKPVSIPRLELQAALIAARLALSIGDALTHKPNKRYFWCDSKNVLCWLRNDARSFKPFVAHRIGEILEITSVSEWRWIPTSLNVADDATRFRSASLSVNDRWYQGPDFLLQCQNKWPSESQKEGSTFSMTELKSNAKVNLTTVHQNETVARNDIFLVADCFRFSSWLRFLRSVALVHRYIRNLRLIVLRKKGVDTSKIVWLKNYVTMYEISQCGNRTTDSATLTADDLDLARLHVFRSCQSESFEQELKCLRSNVPLPRESKLRRLDVVLENDGLIHIAGRISMVQNVEDTIKHPIVLDGEHRAVQLLILYFHIKAAHNNNETVLNEMRQYFHIFRLRSIIRKVVHQCKFCMIRKATPNTPPIGDLPPARLAHHQRPFTFTGIDYFGPVNVSVARRTEKRYVALLTCLTTRAIHLEIVHSLSADSAVMALRRFIARRGTPTEMWSDNGTAFVGALKELRELYREPLVTFAANSGIKWRFIPPAAPFMGGAWERLVRSVKTALKVTLKEQRPRDELLVTLLAEAEALINSRPLTYIATAATEEALTPSHFLLGTSSGSPATVSLTDRDLCGRSEWRKAIRLSDHFWRRWLTEYLPTLIPKRTASTQHINLKIGDIVFIVDANLPRGSWPKGRITAVFPGKDGRVRVAEVLTAAGKFKRPAKKLIRLPVE